MKIRLIFLLLLFLVPSFILYNKLSAKKTLAPEPEVVNQAKETTAQIAPLPVNAALVNYQLENYLQNIIEEDDGKAFCVHYLYGYDERKNSSMIDAYVWAYCEEYTLSNGQLLMGSGVSEPVLVYLELQNGVLGIQGHKTPLDGDGYAESIRKMFPENYANQAIEGYDVTKFSPTPKEKAENYYNL